MAPRFDCPFSAYDSAIRPERAEEDDFDGLVAVGHPVPVVALHVTRTRSRKGYTPSNHGVTQEGWLPGNL